MNDMATVQPRRIHPASPSPIARPVLKPLPLLLLLAWRVDAPAPMVTAAEARAGRIRALEAKARRKAEAFKPIEALRQNPDFQARVAAIQARRGAPLVCARPVTAPMPLAAG